MSLLLRVSRRFHSLAAVIHLALGSPDGAPDPTEVADDLASIGIDTTDLVVGDVQTWGEKAYRGTDKNGSGLLVAVIGRDATDAQLLTKMGRFLWYKDSGPILSFSRQQQIEHRAFALLLAERAGVRVPHVITAATIGSRGDATLVMQANAGTALDELPSNELTDSFLDDAWSQLSMLHSAGITHGSISGKSFQKTNEGAAIRDLATANTTPDTDAFCIDRVALLTSIADAADQQQAVTSAQRSLGNEGLAALLPYLQTTALSRVNRKSASGLKKTCSDLRSAVSAATKVEAPKLEELRRVAPSSILIAGFTIFGMQARFIVSLPGIAAVQT